MKYIILSPERSTPDAPVFWKADACGYTNYPFVAGIYDEAEVKRAPDYYNNGFSSVAIPLTEEAMEKLGFKCSFKKGGLEQFFQRSSQKRPTKC